MPLLSTTTTTSRSKVLLKTTLLANLHVQKPNISEYERVQTGMESTGRAQLWGWKSSVMDLDKITNDYICTSDQIRGGLGAQAAGACQSQHGGIVLCKGPLFSVDSGDGRQAIHNLSGKPCGLSAMARISEGLRETTSYPVEVLLQEKISIDEGRKGRLIITSLLTWKLESRRSLDEVKQWEIIIRDEGGICLTAYFPSFLPPSPPAVGVSMATVSTVQAVFQLISLQWEDTALISFTRMTFQQTVFQTFLAPQTQIPLVLPLRHIIPRQGLFGAFIAI